MYKLLEKNYLQFLNLVKNIFRERSERQILGRWCHVSLPKCCNNVIEKKIDFANRDNSLCYNKSTKKY